MFGMYLVPISVYKFKIHSKLHLNLYLELANICVRILSEILQFYPHLNLRTVFLALKLSQICCTNIYEQIFSGKLAI